MATADSFLAFFTNMLLSKTVMDDRFFTFLRDAIDDTTRTIFQERSGILSNAVVGLASTVVDTFDLDLSNAERVLVSGGQIIDLSQLDLDYYTKKIKFENASGIDYHVGVRHASYLTERGVPDSLELDSRKGIPQYTSMMEVFGEYGLPTSITDTPNVKIKIIIDDLTEASVSNAGRKAKVWLKTPVANTLTDALWEGEVQWDSFNNYVEITYSGADGPLGQDTSSDPPSTTASDYRVWIPGPTVKRNTDLSTDSTYAYIGTVTGVGAGSSPTVFDTSAQDLIFLITLQNAYDGIGSGGGRLMNIDYDPIEMRSHYGEDLDPSNRILRIFNQEQKEFGRIESCGRVVDTARFKDHFHYKKFEYLYSGGSLSLNQYPDDLYSISVVGDDSGILMYQPNTTSPPLPVSLPSSLIDISGALFFYVDSGSSDNSVGLFGPSVIRLKQRRIGLHFRFALSQIVNQKVWLRLRTLIPGVWRGIGVYINDSVLSAAFWDTTGTPNYLEDPILSTTLLSPVVADTLYDVYMVLVSNTVAHFWITGASSHVALDLSTRVDVDTLSDDDGSFWCLAGSIKNTSAAELSMILDHWEVWTADQLPVVS
jgi:hypothetical protein